VYFKVPDVFVGLLALVDKLFAEVFGGES